MLVYMPTVRHRAEKTNKERWKERQRKGKREKERYRMTKCNVNEVLGRKSGYSFSFLSLGPFIQDKIYFLLPFIVLQIEGEFYKF